MFCNFQPQIMEALGGDLRRLRSAAIAYMVFGVLVLVAVAAIGVAACSGPDAVSGATVSTSS